jgi:hypothetical protein
MECSTPSKLMAMERPGKFEHHQFVGDKRTQVVYDVDATTNEAAVNELIESEQYMSFNPDTLAEARNRGYRIAKH